VRIAVIHALEESVGPARLAFAELWPEAYSFDLLDTSLAVDRLDRGELDEAMSQRFCGLADYAGSSVGRGGRTAGILFTCSAFGPAIDAVKAVSSIPAFRPNEAAFDLALDRGGNLGLVVSFEPSLGALEAELREMAAARGISVSVKSALAAGALEALRRGDGETHDRVVADSVARLGRVDAVILGQFSLARARAAAERASGLPVLTTPHCAVEALRRRIVGDRARAGANDTGRDAGAKEGKTTSARGSAPSLHRGP
jgi:Asp/Glu/hydantoin racemase